MRYAGILAYRLADARLQFLCRRYDREGFHDLAERLALFEPVTNEETWMAVTCANFPDWDALAPLVYLNPDGTVHRPKD